MAAPAPPTLRQRCLHALASQLAEAERGLPAPPGLGEGAAALPAELRLELLLLLACWKLLDAATCELLAGDGVDGSLLAGAATVSLVGCALLRPASLRALFCTPLPQLRSLSLRHLPWLRDADVALLLPHCLGLRRLDLAKCPRLTAAAVAAAACAVPRLESLSLAGCWQVDVLPTLSTCSQLTSLNLSGCWQATDVALRVVRACGLRGVDAAACLAFEPPCLACLAASPCLSLPAWTARGFNAAAASPLAWPAVLMLLPPPPLSTRTACTPVSLQVLRGLPQLEELCLAGNSSLGAVSLVSSAAGAALPAAPPAGPAGHPGGPPGAAPPAAGIGAGGAAAPGAAAAAAAAGGAAAGGAAAAAAVAPAARPDRDAHLGGFLAEEDEDADSQELQEALSELRFPLAGVVLPQVRRWLHLPAGCACGMRLLRTSLSMPPLRNPSP